MLFGFGVVIKSFPCLELKDKCAQKSKKNHLDLPDPRPTGTIQVSFTSRVFPTALRESRMPEEEEVRVDVFLPSVGCCLSFEQHEAK